MVGVIASEVAGLTFPAGVQGLTHAVGGETETQPAPEKAVAVGVAELKFPGFGQRLAAVPDEAEGVDEVAVGREKIRRQQKSQPACRAVEAFAQHRIGVLLLREAAGEAVAFAKTSGRRAGGAFGRSGFFFGRGMKGRLRHGGTKRGAEVGRGGGGWHEGSDGAEASYR